MTTATDEVKYEEIPKEEDNQHLDNLIKETVDNLTKAAAALEEDIRGLKVYLFDSSRMIENLSKDFQHNLNELKNKEQDLRVLHNELAKNKN